MLSERAVGVCGEEGYGVRPGDIVLDCGADVGVFARTALKAGAERVVAVEVVPTRSSACAEPSKARFRPGV